MNTNQYINAMLQRRIRENSLRQAKVMNTNLVDFCSNDYLGFAQHQDIRSKWLKEVSNQRLVGATGSRLLTGHHVIVEELETMLATFHQSESALIFNSGYDANISLLMTLARRKDLIIYDELVHASIHDAMKICPAPNLVFKHNNAAHLEELLQENTSKYSNIFVLTESIYSMDGDQAPVHKIAKLQSQYQFNWIVDEAHSTGTFGQKGEGLIIQEKLNKFVFARLHTFGKAIGAQGAAVVGSKELCQFLFNFARPLIYTTAPTLPNLLFIKIIYQYLEDQGNTLLNNLQQNIQFFIQTWNKYKLPYNRIDSISSIQSIIVGGNEKTRNLATKIQETGFDVRPILAPTVPQGQERIRICIHAYNTLEQVEKLIQSFQ